MVRFLSWLKAVLLSVVNGLARTVMALLLVIAVLLIVGLVRGDGLPGNMVLALDLREPMDDSRAPSTGFLASRRTTVMDVVLGLDAAGRDHRVKGMVMRLGNGALSTAEAQEVAGAIKRFRARGKFVMAQASAFFSPGLGDYLAGLATLEDVIEIDPRSGVHFITGGNRAPNPTDLLGSQEMRKLIKQLTQIYDLVVQIGRAHV